VAWIAFPLKRLPGSALVVLCCLLLAACGGNEATSPDPTPTVSSTIPPTLPPGAITVGDLLDRMDAAWGDVRSMRTTFWSAPDGEIASPAANGAVTIEEIVLPANRRVVQLVDGAVVDEQIAVDGRVFMKGSLVPVAIAPMMDAKTWVEIDPAAAASSAPIAQQIAYLMSPVTSPMGVVSPETRNLQAVPAGEVTVGGRVCAVYTFASGGISYELAIDDNDLPCRLVMSASGAVNVTLYEFNVPGLVLSAPELATPPAP
jgi:hypothetical protein